MHSLLKFRKILVLMAGLAMSFSVFADTSIDGSKEGLDEQPAKVCLKDVSQPKDVLEDKEVELAKLEDEKKKDLNWFEKLVKHHKLGSLHFQDIIELFH